MKRNRCTLFALALLTLAPALALGQAGKASVERVRRQLSGFHRPLEVMSMNALLTKSETYQWGGASWTKSGQSLYSYSGDNRTEQVDEDCGESSCTPTYRTRYEYSNGRMTRETFEAWDDGSGAYVNETRSVYTYDGNSTTPLTILDQVWDSGSGSFKDAMRTTFAYQAGVPTSVTTDTLRNENWEPQMRYLMAESEGNVIYLEQEWGGSAWVDASRTTYFETTLATLFDRMVDLADVFEAYSGLVGLVAMPDSKYEEWDGFQNEWVPWSRQTTEHTYDVPSGALLKSTSVLESWDEDAGMWAVDSRIVVNYETVGNDTRPKSDEMQATFDGTTWMTFSSDTFEYDGSGNLATVTTQMNFGAGLTNWFQYRFTWSGTGTDVQAEDLPDAFALEPAYPNPFNPSTTVTFTLASASDVSVRVYDAHGRMVAELAEGMRAAGTHRVAFDAKGLAGGTYLVRLVAAGHQQTRAVVLLK